LDERRIQNQSIKSEAENFRENTLPNYPKGVGGGLIREIQEGRKAEKKKTGFPGGLIHGTCPRRSPGSESSSSETGQKKGRRCYSNYICAGGPAGKILEGGTGFERGKKVGREDGTIGSRTR